MIIALKFVIMCQNLILIMFIYNTCFELVMSIQQIIPSRLLPIKKLYIHQHL